MSKLPPVQSCILNIYKEFKRVCEKNNLRFCGVAGTAIGAVRHNGFIPWDDDLDIGMPIKDFEKFRKIANAELSDNYGFVDVFWMGGKVYDKRTALIDVRSLTNTKKYHGVYLDIFPMIGTPNKKEKRDSFLKDIELFKVNAELYENYPDVSSFSKTELNKWRDYLLHAYDFDSSIKVAGFCYFLYDGDGFRKPTTFSFEDTTMPISSSYDSDLTDHFGDYMKLPPKSERKTHDKYHLLDLERPFSKYAKDYGEIEEWLRKLLDKKQHIEGELTQYSNSLLYDLEQERKRSMELSSELEALKASREYTIGKRIVTPLRKIKNRRKND